MRSGSHLDVLQGFLLLNLLHHLPRCVVLGCALGAASSYLFLGDAGSQARNLKAEPGDIVAGGSALNNVVFKFIVESAVSHSLAKIIALKSCLWCGLW